MSCVSINASDEVAVRGNDALDGDEVLGDDDGAAGIENFYSAHGFDFICMHITQVYTD